MSPKSKNDNAELVEKLLDMERQYAFEYYYLSRYLKHLEFACRGLHRILDQCDPPLGKECTLDFLLKQDRFTPSDQLLEQLWRQRFERYSPKR